MRFKQRRGAQRLAKQFGNATAPLLTEVDFTDCWHNNQASKWAEVWIQLLGNGLLP